MMIRRTWNNGRSFREARHVQDRLLDTACFFLDLDAADTERSRIGEQFLREFGDGDHVRSDGVGDVVGIHLYRKSVPRVLIHL